MHAFEKRHVLTRAGAMAASLLLLAVAACSRVDEVECKEIQPGMTHEQVEDRIGKPADGCVAPFNGEQRCNYIDDHCSNRDETVCNCHVIYDAATNKVSQAEWACGGCEDYDD